MGLKIGILHYITNGNTARNLLRLHLGTERGHINGALSKVMPVSKRRCVGLISLTNAQVIMPNSTSICRSSTNPAPKALDRSLRPLLASELSLRIDRARNRRPLYLTSLVHFDRAGGSFGDRG